MASKKVSDLAVVATPDVDDLMMVVQGGTSKQQSLDQIPRSSGFIGGFHFGAPDTQAMLAAAGFVEFATAIDGSLGRGNIAAQHASPPARIDMTNRDDFALLLVTWTGKFSVAAFLEFELGNGTDRFAYMAQDVPADSIVTVSLLTAYIPGGGTKDFGVRVNTDTDGTLSTYQVAAQAISI